MRLRIRGARALTLARGPIPRRAGALGELSVIDPCDVVTDDARILAIGPTGTVAPAPPGVQERVIDARGRVLLPGFVDAHTHACWAGDRTEEWLRRIRGEPYLDTLKAGGGIMATVRAVRAASQAELEGNLKARLGVMLREGTTTVEVKSGYGLTTRDELKMLRAIARCAQPNEPGAQATGFPSTPESRPDSIASGAPRPAWKRDPAAPILGAPRATPPASTSAAAPAARGNSPRSQLPTVLPTALLAHAIDAEQPADRFGAGREGFIRRTIEDTLPGVAREFLARFPDLCVDAYCEEGAWTPEECAALFEAAAALGMRIRAHVDQFHALGLVEWAIGVAGQLHAEESALRSLDHLEATSADDLRRLAKTNIFGVALPCAGWNTNGRFMRARPFVDAGGLLVLATNCNPGSAPGSSMPFAIALAVRYLGLTPAEAISACTVNAAALLGLTDRGALAPGTRADMILLRHTDERALAYEFGGNPVDHVICAGELVGPAPE